MARFSGSLSLHVTRPTRIVSMDMFGTAVLSVLNRLHLQGDDHGGISLAAFVSPPR
jgi:hypothetical protein